MKTKSAKAKGRRLQNWVQQQFKSKCGIKIRVRIMGESGDDVYCDDPSWPFYIECKNKEKISIWNEYSQLREKADNKIPVLFIKRNREKPLAVIDGSLFFHLIGTTWIGRNF